MLCSIRGYTRIASSAVCDPRTCASYGLSTPAGGIMENADIEIHRRCPRSVEQTRRALKLLELADVSENPDTRFILQVGALHLTRAIPEYWYTTAAQIPSSLNMTGSEADQLKKRLVSEFESIFGAARRYELITDLRRWDFHWEPLINPKSIGPNGVYGRGAPLVLTTGPNARSSATYIGGTNEVLTTGSGRRIGRTNYYQIRQCRFVDFERSEAVPLALAIHEFLEDIPGCIERIMTIPEVARYAAEL